MTQKNDILLQKLDAFIKKYYTNELIKGSILSTSIFLSVLLFLSVAEYFGNFEPSVRKIFFSFILLSFLFVFGKFILIPLIKLFRIGKTISYEEAAIFVGKHFKEVQDKLLNYLQLEKLGQTEQNELILASIEQKTRELSPVPFTSAINFSENKKYLKYLIPVILFFAAVFGYEPSIIKESTARIIRYNEKFDKPLPYVIEIQNSNLTAVQGEDFKLNIKVSGKILPKEVYLVSGDSKFKMKKEAAGSFSFIFNNIQKSVAFSFETPLLTTESYELTVFPRPKINKLQIAFHYPGYLQKNNDSQENVGDIVVPEGTKASWQITTENVKNIKIQFADTIVLTNKTSQNKFEITKTLRQSQKYGIILESEQNLQDTVFYTISVIPDKYPTIVFEPQQDSANLKIMYFKGSVADDYGLTQLQFRFKNISSDTAKWQIADIPVNKSIRDVFYHLWDLTEYPLNPGDELQYYFIVWDNDEVNGRKSTTTNKFIYKIPDLEELQKLKEQTSEQIKATMSEALSEAQQLQKQFDELYEKIAQKKELTWEDKKQMKDLLEKEKALEKKIQNLEQQNMQNIMRTQSFEKPSEELLKKQEQVQKLFEEIIPPEMKEKFKQLDELMEKLSKEQIQEMLKDMELSNKEIEKELDRTLELFKQLEFEQKLEETIEKTQKLAEEQQKLLEETLDKNSDSEKLKNKQDELQDMFNQLKEDLKMLEEKNSQLENPHQMPDLEENLDNIQQEMQNSSQNLEKGNKKKSSQNQKNAVDQMKQMENKMSGFQSEMQQEAHEEDLNTLRQILDNLIKVSFTQEDLMNELKKVDRSDPRYVEIGREQKKLQDDIRLIEDSLLALSKRVPEISSVINREIAQIHSDMEQVLEFIQDRKTNEATAKQQFLLTSVNNLALLLDEIVQQMQQQMAQQKFGNSSCSKPGSNSTPKAGSLKQMQQQLNKQLEGLKQQLEQGKKPGGKQGQNLSKQLAQLAAQQEAIRNELRKMAEQLEKEGNLGGKGNLEKIADMMEETEEDIVNKQITQETLMRQQEILTRLLEHEKSEREREMSQERQSKEAFNYEKRNKIEFLEYKKMKEKELELYKTVPPKLKPFYKNKVNNYFENL
jgi:hypothetical protein